MLAYHQSHDAIPVGDPVTSSHAHALCRHLGTGERLIFVMVACLTLILSRTALGHEGIVTDGSVGAAPYLGSVHTLSPPSGPQSVTVSQSMGSTQGQNLFQSFSQFNIAPGQTVTFTEDKVGFIENIIARVTGHEASQINGTLRVTPEGRANFYLLNPNGVLFGQGAQIDVPGDFHVTTASYVKFQDGARYGTDPVTSKLSSSAPVAFGFVGANPSNNVLIDVSDGATLATQHRHTAIDLVGANLSISKGASLVAAQEGSEIRLVASKGRHEVSVMKDASGYLPLPYTKPNRENAGAITLDSGASLLSRSPTGGRIGIWGQSLDLSQGSTIGVYHSGDSDPDSSQGIHATLNTLSIRDEGSAVSRIFTMNDAKGHGADIHLSVGDRIEIHNNIHSADFNGIYSISQGSGDGGNIRIEAGSMAMSGGAPFGATAEITAEARAGGASGNVDIRTRGSLLMANDASISAKALGAPRAGHLKLAIGGDLTIRNRSLIQDLALPFESNPSNGEGETGDIRVTANNIKIIDLGQNANPHDTGIFSRNEFGYGAVGNIDVISRGNIDIRGGYGYVAPKQDGSDDAKIVGISSYSNTLSPNVGHLNVWSQGKITLHGYGEDEPHDASGLFRFLNPTVETGISSLVHEPSDAPPPSVHVHAGEGISLTQSIILVGGKLNQSDQMPTVRVSSEGPISLQRSEIANAVKVMSQDSKNFGTGVSVLGGSLLMQDKSNLYSNVPGYGIDVRSDAGVFISSKTVNVHYPYNQDPLYLPDVAMYYSGDYGLGNISISAKDNLIIYNASIGSEITSKSIMNARLNLSLSAENVLISAALLGLGSNQSQLNSQSSSIDLDSQGVFPLFNVINNSFYTDESGLIASIRPNYPSGLNNRVIKSSGNRITDDFTVSGSLFGISGVLPTLSLPEFGSEGDLLSCQTFKKGELSLTGRGRLTGETPSGLY